MAVDKQSLDGTDQDTTPKDEQGTPRSAGPSLLRRLITSRWTLLAVTTWAVIQTAALAAYYAWGLSAAVPPAELTLGQFHFEAQPAQPDLVRRADFTLHVVAAPSLERFAGQQLAQKQLRVRQAIEELLRLAGPSDFADPVLGELKRRIKAKLNELLGIQAVADVLVTDLKLELASSETVSQSANDSERSAESAAGQEALSSDRAPSATSEPASESLSVSQPTGE